MVGDHRFCGTGSAHEDLSEIAGVWWIVSVMRANSLRTNAAAGQGGGIRAATCYEAYSGFGGKSMRNLAHQSERPFLRPRTAQVACPSTTVVGPNPPVVMQRLWLEIHGAGHSV